MERIRTLIVDDELNARKGIRTLLARDPELEVVGECGDGRAAVESIERLAPDLVLLDVQMPHRNGFEVLEALDLERPPIRSEERRVGKEGRYRWGPDYEKKKEVERREII